VEGAKFNATEKASKSLTRKMSSLKSILFAPAFATHSGSKIAVDSTGILFSFFSGIKTE
jgi:Kef-type K+ transport system membrane component KefB